MQTKQNLVLTAKVIAVMYCTTTLNVRNTSVQKVWHKKMQDKGWFILHPSFYVCTVARDFQPSVFFISQTYRGS
jgi:hypothetical protein